MDQAKEQLQRLPQVCADTGLSRSSIYAKMATGAFPKPVQLGPRSVAWRQAEIQSWIAERIREREAVS